MFWAPLIDKLPVPWLTGRLGRRRSWLLVAQGAIIAALLGMSVTDPVQHLAAMAAFAVMLGFSSATQDIVIDAYRIEAAEEDLQGLMSAAYIAGYRIGMILAGAGALELAGRLDPSVGYHLASWALTYKAMAGVMGLAVVATLLIPEPERSTPETPHSLGDYLRFLSLFAAAAATFVLGFWLTGDVTETARQALVSAGHTKELAEFLTGAGRLIVSVGAAGLVAFLLAVMGAAPKAMVEDALVAPFRDLARRFGKAALIILALIMLYRIADVVMG